MNGLVEFLTAAIAEDEAVARAAGDHQGASWLAYGEEFVHPDPPPGNSYVAIGPWGGNIGPAAPHIARWDPARVLAECEAKRRQIRVLTTMFAPSSRRFAPWRDRVLAIMALPYADRPGFREEWRA